MCENEQITRKAPAEISEMSDQELNELRNTLRYYEDIIDDQLAYIGNESHGRLNGFCYLCENSLKDCKCNLDRKLSQETIKKFMS